MCSGSEAGLYLRLIDFVYHPNLGVRVIKKKSSNHHCTRWASSREAEAHSRLGFRLSKGEGCAIDDAQGVYTPKPGSPTARKFVPSCPTVLQSRPLERGG